MATLYDGTRTTFTDTTPQVRVITDLISIISPRDTPLIARFGVQSAPPAGWKVSGWPGKKIEWLEDELMPMSDTLAASITSVATTITVADASVFHVGDLLLVDSEEMWVSARNTGTNVLTVERDFAGTTAATHASAAVVKVIGNAQLEAQDSAEGSTVDITAPYNVVQRFADEVRAGDLERKISLYGIDDDLEYQVEKKIQENMKKLEQNLLLGARNEAADNTSPNALGSLDYYINVAGGNTISAGGAVTQADFEDALELAYLDGGAPSIAVLSPANMQVVKNFYDSASYLRIERSETTVGMVIQEILTPFGTVELLMDRYQGDSTILLIDPEHYSGPLAVDPWEREILARTGWYSKAMLTGVFTQMIRHGAKAHAAIVAIS